MTCIFNKALAIHLQKVNNPSKTIAVLFSNILSIRRD